MTSEARTHGPALPVYLQDFAGCVLRIAALLEEVGDTQWRRSHAPRPSYDTDERGKGGLAHDPTLDTVADDRRLALRAAVRQGERVVASAAAWMNLLAARLEKALTSPLKTTGAMGPEPKESV